MPIKKSYFSLVAPILLIICATGCYSKKDNSLFTSLSPAQSGIHFINTIDENKTPNNALDEFAYMGGGVGVLDINNDGKKDLFFCGNQVSSKLYLNLGDNKFEDISEAAGINTDGWSSGVSIADVNGDGYDDIYICRYDKTPAAKKGNLLFINQHNNTFKEEAATYGLTGTGNSTQAVFFDYDGDGDLDMFLTNYQLNASYSANYLFPRNRNGNSPANDRLYRNDGDVQGKGHPVFTDVTMAAGIKEDGYGLGVSVADFNNDGWPDIYVANDFLSNDELWLNNKNGTFTDEIATSTGHQSYSSMGCDAADINNDGNIDLMTLDMMPEDNKRKKLTFSFMNYDRYQEERQLGYTPEFMRNMLQLNNGNYKSGDTLLPYFSEIGQLAGVSETDWSWSVLLADFDNDGKKDIHITNGIGRDFINGDFIQFSMGLGNSSADPSETKKQLKKKLESLDHVTLPDYLYLNNGNYSFRDVSKAAGIDEPAISNGAVYVDLDNDGDLDLVVNNINKEPFVFINNTVQKGKPVAQHSISFALKGDSLNKHGIGAKVFVYNSGKYQVQEEYPVRGYLSTVDTKLIFGTGASVKIDSIKIIWPQGKYQVIKNLSADSVYALNILDAKFLWKIPVDTTATFFTDVTSTSNAIYRHEDFVYNDFAAQRLLPQKFSQLGPFIATADIDKNNTTDFFIGGGFNSSGFLFSQAENGTFTGKPFTTGPKFREDEANVFFDADGDGDEDLLVTFGDTRYPDTSIYYKPILYLNDGKGHFTESPTAIPDNVRTIAGCVAAVDYDGDGDIDLFIGGRVSQNYPKAPKSFLLENQHGIFKDVTNKVCPALSNPGMITAALWTDYNGDKIPDLIIAGEYMPLRFFSNNQHQLKEDTVTGLQNMHGMWRSLIAADVDGDGDTDLVAGNLGLNCKYHVTTNYPMELYAQDIDHNGILDAVPFYYIKDESGNRNLYPAVSRDQLAAQVPSVKKEFLYHTEFAHATANDIFKNKTDLIHLTCNETSSCWIENKGGGKFVLHALPAEAQFAPVNAIICTDVDGDGIKDLLLAGNEYQADVMTGRYDASYGCMLKGTPTGFTYISPQKSGFFLKGDVKDLKMITGKKGEKLILAAINDDFMKMFQLNHPSSP